MVYQDNPFICSRASNINTTCNTQSSEYYKADISKYIPFSINISLIEISKAIYRICYLFLFGL